MKNNLIRPSIVKMLAYTPGEQPRIPGLIKLNTNETPYPPSPKVARAIRRILNGSLRLYPDPVCLNLRAAIAKRYGFKIDEVFCGNGSDEILGACFRAFVDGGQVVQFPFPTYSLYPVLSKIHHARIREIPCGKDFSLALAQFDPRATLTFVANPNSPTGTLLSNAFLRKLARRLKGVLVIDEAYVDFAKSHALPLVRTEKNVIVTRTSSKSFALAGLRVGYAIGNRELIGALFKIKDSYNLDRLAQAAGQAAIEDIAYHRRLIKKVNRTREWCRRELIKRGWHTPPSEGNFLFTRPARHPAKKWLDILRKNKILIRWFEHPQIRDWLRISIGSDAEMRQLLKIVDKSN
ncbi:MAG: histidinol-phosphate transaminase [Verrucomicrobiae bacterium]|nr:histidinol-phosphate transaminase [Verrucomicrobiae bacterium]